MTNLAIPRRALRLDAEKYDRMLDASVISEGQRRAFIEAMWSVVVAFVDFGYDIQPFESCGQSDESASTSPEPDCDLVEYIHSEMTDEFAEMAARKGDDANV